MSATYTTFNFVLNRLLSNTIGSLPSTIYFGFSSTPIAVDGTGATEPSGSGYARIGVSTSTGFTTSTVGSSSNVAAITFAISTGSWGTLPYAAIWDASSAGNIWYYATLSPSITVVTNTTIYFDPGGVVFSMSN